MLFAIYKEYKAEHDEERVLRLGSMILNYAKVKRDHKQKQLMFMDINIAGQRRSALVYMGTFNLFRSKKAVGKLGLSISISTKRIKTVNSK